MHLQIFIAAWDSIELLLLITEASFGVWHVILCNKINLDSSEFAIYSYAVEPK